MDPCNMDEISLMLKYSGFWIDDKVYDTKHVDGIVIPYRSTYKMLQEVVTHQIGVDLNKKRMRIRYIVDSSPIPMEIRNDMGVKLYLMLKKKVANFESYPICIDVVEKTADMSMQGSFDTLTGAVDCVEGPDGCRSLVALGSEDVTPLNELHIIRDPWNKDIEVGQTYLDKKTLVSVMHHYALLNRFQFYTKRSDTINYILSCCVETCPWYFRASTIHKTSLVKVRAFDNIHTCTITERGFTQRQANTKMVAALAMEQLRNHKRKHTPNDIKDDLLLSMGVEISYNKAWRAKELALKILYGKPSDGYRQLPKYLYVLGEKYPGSYLRYHKGDMNEFMYLFIALNVSIEGFLHCRPIVVVDGSHLKGPYMGTFISASTLDGAGNILPLAYGVVDSENDASWSWFFEQFKTAFGVRQDMAIVSDRNESIWNSVRIVFPEVRHYACMWHVWKNVCKNYRKSQDTLSCLYYQMAKCYRRTEFEELMTQLEQTDPRVKAYLVDVGYEKWARSFAPTNRGRMTTSNIAECINSCLVEARKLPFLEFLEKVRELFAKWNCVNGEKARYMASSRLGDRFQEILTMNEFKSRRMTAVKNSEFVYTVEDRGSRSIVCLNRNTCKCGKFQYDEIPCEHAVAVLRAKGIIDMIPYCSHYYKKETLENIYMHAFAPMPLKSDWYVPPGVLEEVLLPPGYKRPPGRPRVVRVKNKSESFRACTNCCSKCGRAGHNRRSCKLFPTEE